MASFEGVLAPEVYRCYYCNVESADHPFKYFDNKKENQPRHQCVNCHKLFTVGSHDRPHGKTYAKKRNVDPDELKNLSRQCRHCGAVDNAVFKYYNNHNCSQPRFKCLSCGLQFQMRLLGMGDEMHLVHASSHQRSGPRRRKQVVCDATISSTSSSSQEGVYQACDGSSDSVMPLEFCSGLVPHESVEYANQSLDAEMTEPQETCGANFTSSTGVGENVEIPPLSAEDALLLVQWWENNMMAQAERTHQVASETCEANFTSSTGVGDEVEIPPLSAEDDLLLENDMTAEEGESTHEVACDDAFPLPPANMATTDAVPSIWSTEDVAELMGFMEEADATDNEALLDVDMPVSDDVTEIFPFEGIKL